MEEFPFKFIQNVVAKKWVVAANSRSKRPNTSKGLEPTCPFCPGREDNLPKEVYRLDFDSDQKDENWDIRVVPNKFPFAPVHELITHSPDYLKTVPDLSIHQVEKLVWVYRHRIQYYKNLGEGTPFIFNNTGEVAGASLPHQHSQLVVTPPKVKLSIDPLGKIENVVLETKHFDVFTPSYSGMPYEIWAAPKTRTERGRGFWEVTDGELFDLAHILQKVTRAITKKYGAGAPYNYYIYPGGDWYIRFIPRERVIGGFELATGVYVDSAPIEEVISFFQKELG
jgi:UDPglucose--hexose-1-phosphate uridylyltransferase